MEKIGIVGATGVAGRAIASALQAQGRSYRAIGRSAASLDSAFARDPLAQRVTWNPGDPESVRAALAGLDTIVYVVGVDYTEFALHPKVMRATLDGAIACGVQRILLIGTVYPYGVPQTTPVREDHPREPHTFKGKMRKEQEDILLAAHAEGSIQATVLRLPDFYGPGVEKSYAASAFDAARTGGTAQLIGPADTPHEYIFIPDMAPVVLRLLDEPRPFGKVWHLGGAGTLTQREFTEKVFATAGREPKLFVVPPWMLKLVGLFNPLMREVSEMQYLFAQPVILDDTAIHELLGEIHKTSYDEGIAQTVAALSPSTA